MYKAIINPRAGFLIAYIMLFINISYKGYFLGDTTFLLGLCVLIYVVKVSVLSHVSYRFFDTDLNIGYYLILRTYFFNQVSAIGNSPAFLF